MANPAVRESRHAVPVGVTMDGMIVMEDDGHLHDVMGNRNDGMGSPASMITTRKVGTTTLVPADQQGEEQRYPYGGYGYGGWGRPPSGRPWGPYGRPWGPYTPYRPWGPF